MANTPASLSTALTGNNNDLDWTAVADGTEGNYIAIKYTDPGTDAASEESISVDYDGGPGGCVLIDITLRNVGDVLSTADEIKAALLADAEASALVTAADKAANDGSGAVIAMAATRLASGAWDSTSGGYESATELQAENWRVGDVALSGTDDGEVVNAGGVSIYRAETYIDGCAVTQAAATAAGLLKAAGSYDTHLASRGKIGHNGAGV